jgi:predicted metalloprotease with PDZ domain
MILRKPDSKQQKNNQHQRRASLKGAHCFGFLLFALLWAVTLIAARAESFKAKIVVLSNESSRVQITGERSVPTRTWSFRNVYANVMNLGERIEKMWLADSSGKEIPVRKLAPGEYEAEREATRFVYEIRLEATPFEGDAAHVSWLTNERGFLMTGDLLPLPASDKDGKASASLSFVLPSSWMIASSVNEGSGGVFELGDAESAVFFVGQNLRRKQHRAGSMELQFVTSGEWAFSDEEIAGMASDLLKDHAQTFGGAAQERATLMLSPFPRPANADHWSAETRGASVIILSGKLPSKTAALAQLSFPLAHELFHLWVPNGLALDGNYDWFYEGFTLYQALRAGIHLNLLTFQDYLNALGRAFDAYKLGRERDKLSLLDASRERWTLQPSLVYNKGMLIAFLYDLTLRQQSKGKRSLDDVYRELFHLYHAPESRMDGNTAVLGVLNSMGEMQEFTRRYVESTSAIDLASAIVPFGLQVDSGGVRTHLSMSTSLSSAQRDLLRKFGYNEKEYGVSGHRGVKKLL